MYNNDRCFVGIEGVEINVEDRKYFVRSVKDGDFWRLFLFGLYKVVVIKRGYFFVKRII